VPTQLANADKHAERRGWRVVARFKDDGYSAFKEITRDDFVRLIEAIERDEIDVVIVRDVDRLTRNLPDWSRFEKAAVEHRVLLSAYSGGDLDLSTPEGAYYWGMETLRAKRESAVKSVRVREGHDRIAREGKSSGGGPRWFGYTRIYANPEETKKRKRVVLREEINEVEAGALRDAAERVLNGETVGSIIREWTRRGIKPARSQRWEESSLVKTLRSAHVAGLREWQGQTYPAQWPGILDEDTHERLVNLFADPSRRAHVVGRKQHLLSGIAVRQVRRPAVPLRGEHGEISDLQVRDRSGRQRVRRDLGRRGNPGGVRDRRGSGRAGIPSRAGSGAGRRGHQRAAPRGTARGDPQGAGQAGRGAAGLGRRYDRQG
jgi:site-specific DNA recombinase